MAKAEFIEKVEGLGNIYRVYANFVDQLKALKSKGIQHPISVRDDSYLGLHGENKEGTRTCHAPIYAKDSPVIVARISPLVQKIEMAQQAVNAHRNSKYPVFDDNNSIYAKWEKIAKTDKGKSPERRRAIILSEREDSNIHRDSDEAMFFWQDVRKDYFNKFVPKDVVPCWQIPVSTVDSAGGTIVNYAWFSDPQVGSGLDFGGRGLSYDVAALGVKKGAEGASQKSSVELPYTQGQLAKNMAILNRLKQGKVKVSDLESEVEKVSQFLESLKQ